MERFDLLFSHNVDGVFFMTLDEPFHWDGRDALLDYAFEHLRLTAINDVMCAQLGAPREALIGTAPCQRWAEDRATWCARMRELYDRGHVYTETLAPRSDGTWLDVEGVYVCTYDDAGRITGHFGTQRDVTSHKRTGERLERAMVAGDIGVWDFDLVTGQVHADESWIRRLGYRPEDALHDRAWWSELQHPATRVATSAAFAQLVSGEQPTYRVEHRMRRADGTWLWFLSTGAITARDAGGRPLRMSGTSINITERKELQERLFLSERLASLGTLAAGVGHEINNPLTYIALNLALLEREVQGNAKLLGLLEQVRYGTERVRAVVRDLQALTRVPEEQHAIVDVNAIVDRCIAMADHQIRHRAQLVRELGTVPAVRGNEGRVAQLVLNLLVNAAQAIPEGSAERHAIRVVTTTAADGRAELAVTDTGAGVPPDVVGRIFDPFFTTKPVGEGTGLGLSICRSIVVAMDGEIDVDTTPGRGTTFRVRLPAAQPSVIAAPPPPVRAPARPAIRLLVIDDEPTVLHAIAKILGEHEVTAETSARAALARLRAGERFDRILCDVMMPELTGMDFYDALAEVAPAQRARVIFMSGGAFTERAQRFLESLPNRCIDKPFEIATLRACLHDPLPA